MVGMNIDNLGISELKWTRMGKVNSDDDCNYYYGQESFSRNKVTLVVYKTIQNAVLGCNLRKGQNDLCSLPRQTIQYHSNPILCPNH